MEILFIFAACLLLAACLITYMYREAFTNRVIYHDLEFAAFPKSFGKVRIFFISDIHRREVSHKVIEKIKGKADIVIIGGDLTEKGVPFERVQENLQALKTLGPVFFVWGNNDYEVEAPLLDALLLNQGVKALSNSSITFESETGDRLFLLGVDDISTNREDLEEALSETKEEGFRLFVSHNPQIRKRIRPEHGIHLMLSGHTHGGQIRLFGFGLYEKGGLIWEHGRTILISNGYGTTGVPLRLGARAETHLITLSHPSEII
ncbi:metallophosphoesterase [Bacillus benzoevorans]|uniref:Putative MPP superfamily phosphohydrolase n=1 Tax=Bacillus benzoevorans TaxID=1456 RepID=A0A7X0HPT5_9BACI|nr:metallophosphoesterase [Bacillus benzoevorans]MBB6444728.1 putative MPP superfamily phosphohydrolase [Bacillus benzoevorans]